MQSLSAFLLDRGRRCLLACAGLILFSYGFFLQLQANMGLAPWNALNQGLSFQFGFSLGTASILMSVLIIIIDLVMGETIGLGTILDALIVGWFTDLFVWLDFPSHQTSFPFQLATLLIGIVLCCFGQWLYMLAGLSCGPRDALLVALGKRVPKIPIGTVNIVLCMAVLAVGIALGSPFGLGTVIATFGTGAIMNLIFKLLHFEPRDITHEGLGQTISAFAQALKHTSTK